MNEHFGQIFLLAAMVLFAIYVFRLRTILFDRLIYLVCALVGIILVINPDLSTWVAHELGIGRGVDLMFYLFIIAALFYSVSITSDMKKMQRQMTAIIRKMAVDNPAQGQPTAQTPGFHPLENSTPEKQTDPPGDKP